MISREKCLEWAKEASLIGPTAFQSTLINAIEALINRAYAEGQKDMRERIADFWIQDQEYRDPIRALEIE